MLVQSTQLKTMMMLSHPIDPAQKPHHAQLQQDSDAFERPKGLITSILGHQGLLTSYLTLVISFTMRPATR